MADDTAPHWWSWADIVRNEDRLGIPNFQRGAVWDSSNRTALLESVYEKSPCGSFVLWRPQRDGLHSHHGVPLRSFKPGVSPMWLVDGQQRTRAMLSIFQQMLKVPTIDRWSLVCQSDLDSLAGIRDGIFEEPQEPDDEDVGDHSFWAVVLPAMRVFDQAGGAYFGSYGESRKILRGSMFRRVSPKARIRLDASRKVKTVPPGAAGAVPLATLVSKASVFHHEQLRAAAQAALRTFNTHEPDLPSLDELIPWGPLFVTGLTYERPAIDGELPSPMLWANLHERRDANIAARVELLAGLFGPEWRNVFDRFEDMLNGNRFAVGWLPSSDVSAAIDAYVRINRAGIRVRAEERALALLSRAHPGLLEDLAKFVHLRDHKSVTDQRSLLTHESDRQLGFAAWMSTLTRYSTLALLGTTGRRWLDTSAIDKETFGYRLDRVGPWETDAGRRTWARDYTNPSDLIQECSERATHALLLVDSVLSKELFLDHRMARPSTRALTPLIDLLYRVPTSVLKSLRDNEPGLCAALATLARWTLLAPYIDQPDLEQLLVDCHGIDETPPTKESPIPVWDESWREQLRLALGRFQTNLAKLWSLKCAGTVELNGRSQLTTGGLSTRAKLDELALISFRSFVDNSLSLQDATVGWLYAIERRRGATEFRWQAQYDGYARDNRIGVEPGDPRSEAVLQRAPGADSEGLYPEKQHIVPFASARQIINKPGTRATRSQANAIGNLTWLSRRQNTLDALADRWTVMDPDRDRNNLDARGMFSSSSTSGSSQTALSLYEQIRDAMLQEREPIKLQALFADFCVARSKWMVEQMREWLQESLPDDAREWLAE